LDYLSEAKNFPFSILYGMGFVERFRAWGHPNIRARHRTTLMVTRDPELTPRGDCIVAVGAEKGLADLSPELREAARSRGARVTLTLEAGGYTFTVSGRGDPGLTLTHPDGSFGLNYLKAAEVEDTNRTHLEEVWAYGNLSVSRIFHDYRDPDGDPPLKSPSKPLRYVAGRLVSFYHEGSGADISAPPHKHITGMGERQPWITPT